MHSATRPFLLVLSVCCGVSAPGQESGKKATEPIRVMTFNIRYGTANDGRNRWERRTHMVVARIRAFAPDILGLQEALHFQVRQLEQALPEYQTFGAYREGKTKSESCRVFVRTDRIAIEASGTFWLSPTPDEVGSKGWDAALPRVCTWAVLRNRKSHSRFLYANTHFDHRGRTARLKSAKLISAWTKIFRLPTIVTGDFNSDEGTTAMRHMREHGLRDSFRVIHPEAKNVATFTGFWRPGRGKIDHVFVSEEFAVANASIDTAKIDGRYPSDHFPVIATVSMPGGVAPKLMPVVQGKPWHIGDNPDLGALTGEKQQIVDHAVFRSRDGAWHLWACIRSTKIGRLLYAWEGSSLEQRVWKQKGIAMRVSPQHGESVDDWGGKEWIQAPHVVTHANRFYMLYGGHRSEMEHCQICLATSADGRKFERHKNAQGQSRVFIGPGEARDPMTIKVGDSFHCYYTGNPDPKDRRDTGGIYCRTSKDLVDWSRPTRVCYGGSPGSGMWSAECPHVVFREGYYYLFRTTSYRKPLTHVYRSKDPMDFGLDSDAKKIGTIAVAAPEVVSDNGRDYISSVHDLKGGVQLMRLAWAMK